MAVMTQTLQKANQMDIGSLLNPAGKSHAFTDVMTLM